MDEREDVSPEDAKALYDDLTSAAYRRSLTETRLRQAMNTIEWDEIISVGAHWIMQNPKFFVSAVGDPEAFLRQYIYAESFCLRRLLSEKSILELIPVARRATFLGIAYPTCGASDLKAMIDAALGLGVDRKVIASALIARIETLKPDALEELQSFLGENVSVFDTSDFELVALLCAEKIPAEVIKMRRRIALRIGEVKAAEICTVAAECVSSLQRLELNDLEALSLKNHLTIALRLEPFEERQAHWTEPQAKTIEFLMQLMIELGEKAHEFFPAIRRVFNSVSPVVLCRTVAWCIFEEAHPRWHVEHEPFEIPIEASKWWGLWLNVEDRLEEAGYIIGRVEEGSFTPRGETRPVRQHQVQYGDELFVADRHQHRYFPAKGDLVLVHATDAEFLTKRGTMRIYRANFTPVDRRKES